MSQPSSGSFEPAQATSGRRRLGVLLLVAMFFAGALCGAAAMRAFWRPRMVRQVSMRIAPTGAAVYDALGPTPEQRRQIDSIVRSIQPHTDSLLGSALPRIAELVRSADSAIRVVLTPEQRRMLDSLTRVRVDSASRR